MKYKKNGEIEVAFVNPITGTYLVLVPILDQDDGYTFVVDISKKFSLCGGSVFFEEDFWRPLLSDDDINLIRNKLREGCEIFWEGAQDEVDFLLRSMEANSFDLVKLSPLFRSTINDYVNIMKYVPKNMVVLDLGCGGCGGANSTHSWLFKNHARYIGVDVWGETKTKLDPENSEYFRMDIQEFVCNVFPKLGFDIKGVFAICLAVPDVEACRLVAEFFPYCRVWFREFDIERKPMSVLPND